MNSMPCDGTCTVLTVWLSNKEPLLGYPGLLQSSGMYASKLSWAAGTLNVGSVTVQDGTGGVALRLGGVIATSIPLPFVSWIKAPV